MLQVGCNWIELKPGQYYLRSDAKKMSNAQVRAAGGRKKQKKNGPAAATTSRPSLSPPVQPHHSQYEIDVAYDKFISHPAEEEWSKV